MIVFAKVTLFVIVKHFIYPVHKENAYINVDILYYYVLMTDWKIIVPIHRS